MFFRLFKTDLKRTLKLLPSLLLMSAVLLLVFSSVAVFSDKVIYKDKDWNTVHIGVMMSADSTYSEIAYSMITDMKSYSSMCDFITVDSEASGKKMLAKGDIEALIIVPDNVVRDIMNGTNTPVQVIYKNSDSFESYVVNQIFVSTSDMLGTSQAAIYTVLSLSRSMNLNENDHDDIKSAINNLYIEQVLSRSERFVRKNIYATGNYDTKTHYTSAGILLLLSLTSILFMAFLKGNNKALLTQLKIHGQSSFKVAFSQVFSTGISMYLIFIFVYLLVWIASLLCNLNLGNFGIMGLFIGIPISLFISLICVLVSKLPANQAAASMALLAIFIIMAYVGGCLVPENLLPKGLRQLCPYTPFNFFVKLLCRYIA